MAANPNDEGLISGITLPPEAFSLVGSDWNLSNQGLGNIDTYYNYNVTNNVANNVASPPKAPPSPEALAFKGLGAGFNAMNARRDAQMQKNELGFDAQIAANQAAMAGYQAQIAQQVGAANEQDSRLKTAAVYGAQRAQMGASGIDLGQGSATDVLASTEYMGERNAMMIRDDTNRQVWQDRNQQALYQAQQQADLAKMNAINPDMAAVTSLAGSAASLIGGL